MRRTVAALSVVVGLFGMLVVLGTASGAPWRPRSDVRFRRDRRHPDWLERARRRSRHPARREDRRRRHQLGSGRSVLEQQVHARPLRHEWSPRYELRLGRRRKRARGRCLRDRASTRRQGRPCRKPVHFGKWRSQLFRRLSLPTFGRRRQGLRIGRGCDRSRRRRRVAGDPARRQDRGDGQGGVDVPGVRLRAHALQRRRDTRSELRFGGERPDPPRLWGLRTRRRAPARWEDHRGRLQRAR